MNWESTWAPEWREVFGQVGKEGGGGFFLFVILTCLVFRKFVLGVWVVMRTVLLDRYYVNLNDLEEFESLYFESNV